MIVEWLLESIEDRHSIFSFVEQEDFRAAVRLDEKIESCMDELEHFSNMGRVGRKPGIRELPIGGTPYVLIYSVSADRVRILRVLHGARDWPKSE